MATDTGLASNAIIIALVTLYLSTVAISMENSCKGCGSRASNLKKLFIALLVIAVLSIAGQLAYIATDTSLTNILWYVMLLSIPTLIVSAIAYSMATDCGVCDTNGTAIKNFFLSALIISAVGLGLGGPAYLYVRTNVPAAIYW